MPHANYGIGNVFTTAMNAMELRRSTLGLQHVRRNRQLRYLTRTHEMRIPGRRRTPPSHHTDRHTCVPPDRSQRGLRFAAAYRVRADIDEPIVAEHTQSSNSHVSSKLDLILIFILSSVVALTSPAVTKQVCSPPDTSMRDRRHAFSVRVTAAYACRAVMFTRISLTIASSTWSRSWIEVMGGAEGGGGLGGGGLGGEGGGGEGGGG